MKILKPRVFSRPIVRMDRLVFGKDELYGLHWQSSPQTTWIGVSDGVIFHVIVDVRPLSLSFGRYDSVYQDVYTSDLVLIPHGFAHGFLVMSETARVHYYSDSEHIPTGDRGIRWDDPRVNIIWPFRGGIPEPILSETDASLPSLRDLSFRDLPSYPEP